MIDVPARPVGRRELWLGFAVFFLIGAAAMAFLNGSGLTALNKYHTDLTQSPHWVAYHGDSFDPDDILVVYATYNETPLQNLIYWVGTFFVDVVYFNKIVGMAIFGLTTGLFFVLVSSMSDLRSGVLAGLFFVIFPRSTYEIAGGFSKAWAIGLVLIAVYVVEKRAWKILPFAMPFAALAYPVSPVLMGAIVAVGLLFLAFDDFPQSWRGFRFLAGGSALALVPLLYKYFTPPDRIGPMITPEVMNAMWERGDSTDVTIPLWQEVLTYVDHPYFVYGTIAVFMLSAWRGLVWKRSWTVLLIASGVAYLIADLVVPRLYLPDRYTRYSIAVLLVLWHSHNWSRLLELIRHRWVQRTTLVAVAFGAAILFPQTFRPCRGVESQGLWEDKGALTPLSRVVAAQPEPMLLAGHPYFLSDVMVQARRPVLVVHRLFHAWFKDYRYEIDSRIRDTFRAIYARDVETVNRLADKYGATHLVVPKECFAESRREKGNIYRAEFSSFVARLAWGPDDFLLNPPPPSVVVYEDDWSWLVRLPLR